MKRIRGRIVDKRPKTQSTDVFFLFHFKDFIVRNEYLDVYAFFHAYYKMSLLILFFFFKFPGCFIFDERSFEASSNLFNLFNHNLWPLPCLTAG